MMDETSPLMKLRQTGRTSRMLLSALSHVALGQTVLVVAATTYHAQTLADHLERLMQNMPLSNAQAMLRCDNNDFFLYTEHVGLGLVSIRSVDATFDWDTLRFKGNGDVPTFVDHFAIEHHHWNLIQAWGTYL